MMGWVRVVAMPAVLLAVEISVLSALSVMAIMGSHH